MNTKTSLVLLITALLLVLPTAAQSQNTLYVSNLDQPAEPYLSLYINARGYFAQRFDTGGNPEGYSELAVQLSMWSNLGSPSGFSLSLYTAARGVLDLPGDLVAPLTGPTPSLAGIYTYTAPTVTLHPHTIYFVAVTASSPQSTGSYRWERSTTQSYSALEGWTMSLRQYYSNDGWNWGAVQGGPLLWGVSATAIPEPSALALLVLGAGALLTARRCQTRTVTQGAHEERS
jgi:hypothetical protein